MGIHFISRCIFQERRRRQMLKGRCTQTGWDQNFVPHFDQRSELWFRNVGSGREAMINGIYLSTQRANSPLCGISLSSFVANCCAMLLGFQCYWELTEIWASARYRHLSHKPSFCYIMPSLYLLCVFPPQFLLSVIHGRNKEVICTPFAPYVFFWLPTPSSIHSCVLHHAAEFNLIMWITFNNWEMRGFSRNEFELCEYYQVKNFHTQTEVSVNLAFVFLTTTCPVLS